MNSPEQARTVHLNENDGDDQVSAALAEVAAAGSSSTTSVDPRSEQHPSRAITHDPSEYSSNQQMYSMKLPVSGQDVSQQSGSAFAASSSVLHQDRVNDNGQTIHSSSNVQEQQSNLPSSNSPTNPMQMYSVMTSGKSSGTQSISQPVQQEKLSTSNLAQHDDLLGFKPDQSNQRDANTLEGNLGNLAGLNVHENLLDHSRSRQPSATLPSGNTLSKPTGFGVETLQQPGPPQLPLFMGSASDATDVQKDNSALQPPQQKIPPLFPKYYNSTGPADQLQPPVTVESLQNDPRHHQSSLEQRSSQFIFPPVSSQMPSGTMQNSVGPSTAALRSQLNLDAQKSPKSPKSNRRTRSGWTEKETMYLMDGCRVHGVGNWKKILNDERYNFHGRTAVDLKDRFRTSFPEEYSRLYPNAKTHKSKRSTGSSSAFNPPLQLVKVNRKERRFFSPEEDARLLEGFLKHGPAWSKIQGDAELGLGNRRGTDLRDRFRNAYPSRYVAAGYKGRTSSAKKGSKKGRNAKNSLEDSSLGGSDFKLEREQMEAEYRIVKAQNDMKYGKSRQNQGNVEAGSGQLGAGSSDHHFPGGNIQSPLMDRHVAGQMDDEFKVVKPDSEQVNYIKLPTAHGTGSGHVADIQDHQFTTGSHLTPAFMDASFPHSMTRDDPNMPLRMVNPNSGIPSHLSHLPRQSVLPGQLGEGVGQMNLPDRVGMPTSDPLFQQMTSNQEPVAGHAWPTPMFYPPGNPAGNYRAEAYMPPKDVSNREHS